MPYWYPEIYLKMWYLTNTGGYQPGRNRFFKTKSYSVYEKFLCYLLMVLSWNMSFLWNFSKTQNWRLFYSKNFQKSPNHRLLVLIFMQLLSEKIISWCIRVDPQEFQSELYFKNITTRSMPWYFETTWNLDYFGHIPYQQILFVFFGS